MFLPDSSAANVNANASCLESRVLTKLKLPAGCCRRRAGQGRTRRNPRAVSLLVNREGAREFLESQGVPFPPGASAHFLPQSSRLIVRNTIDNLELVDALVEQAVSGPKQVEIESKFVEITQNNLKELGFDWLLGPFNLPGVTASWLWRNCLEWPAWQFLRVICQLANFPVEVPGYWPAIAVATLRSVPNAIDALLLGTVSTNRLRRDFSVCPAVFTDPQFQVVIRALNQKKGIDLLSAPKVTTKSGQRAVIEIVREFRYPTQFHAAIPQRSLTFSGNRRISAFPFRDTDDSDRFRNT